MYAIDNAKTFQAVMVLGAPEKRADKDGTLQTTAEGVQKWTVQVAAVFTPNGRRNQAEVLRIGIATDKDLSALPVGPCQLVNPRIGTFQNGEGTTVYFQADDVRPAGGFPAPKGHEDGGK